jgi:hypothetical protein
VSVVARALGLRAANSKMQIQAALDAFLTQLQADGRSAHTRRQYARHAAALERWLARTNRPNDLSRLDHRDLAEFVAAPEASVRPDGARKKATSTVTARYTHPGSRAADVSNLRVNSWPAPTATAAA